MQNHEFSSAEQAIIFIKSYIDFLKRRYIKEGELRPQFVLFIRNFF